MEAIDVLAIIQQYLNIKAVGLAVVFTQGAKYFLTPLWSKDTVPGKVTTRLLPALPLFVGAAFCVLIEKDAAFVAEDVIRGVNSGAFAAYLYRTSKVSIFGE